MTEHLADDAASPRQAPPFGARRPAQALPHVVVRSDRGRLALGLSELWRARELLYFLVWRDVKIRYKQSAVGALWAILQPVLLMIIFSIIFEHVGREFAVVEAVA